jgi:NADH:ubiquinone oxidoreductase subunit 6 (subunit J)
MSLPHLLFWILAAFTGLSAVAVLVSQNIVRSAVWLLFTLAGTAGVFFLIGADFVAATQLIIYVGGILVLVVFGVMLTAQGPFITMKVGAAEWVIATAVGLLLLGVLTVSTLNSDWPVEKSQSMVTNAPPQGYMDNAQTSPSSALLGQGLLGINEVMPIHAMTGVPLGPTKNVPERKRMAYLLPFEIVSVHLLVVLIGAAYLARAKRRRGVVT